MKNIISKHALLFWQLKKIHILSQVEYRFSFFVELLSMVFGDSILVAIWGLFFKTFPSLNGWDLQTMLLFIAVQWGGIGILFLFGAGIFDMCSLIESGRLDFYLTNPINPLFHIAIGRCYVRELATWVVPYILWGHYRGFSINSTFLFLIL